MPSTRATRQPCPARPVAAASVLAGAKVVAGAPVKKSPPSPAAKPAIKVPALDRSSGLIYVSDEMPGISRLKAAGGFRYRNAEGQWLTDPDDIARINQLAIPPAYVRVWICPLRNGHLQATGHDARDRKQYRYHPDWQTQRNDSKFGRMQAFGVALPRLRAQVARDLSPTKNKPVSRTLVLATLVRLLDATFVRVGNDEYARDNGSFGLTTLRMPHAAVRGATLQLRFRGKSGVMQDLKITDPKVAAVVRTCQQLPGQALFQYQDDAGELHAVGSSDVNDYLAQITLSPKPRTGQGKNIAQLSASSAGEAIDLQAQKQAEPHFTAKDFRTWHGTVQALELTRLACSAGNGASGNVKYDAKLICKEVARQLGNTPAVCRKSYIHPAVMRLGSELAGDVASRQNIWERLVQGKPKRHLYAAEARLLAFLKLQQLAADQQMARSKASRSAQPVAARGKPASTAGVDASQ